MLILDPWMITPNDCEETKGPEAGSCWDHKSPVTWQLTENVLEIYCEGVQGGRMKGILL